MNSFGGGEFTEGKFAVGEHRRVRGGPRRVLVGTAKEKCNFSGPKPPEKPLFEAIFELQNGRFFLLSEPHF